MIGAAIALSVGAATLAVLIGAAIAPIETMTWWAGFSEEDLDADPPHLAGDGRPPPAIAYVVYLSGVNVISGDALTSAEKRLLKRLAAETPGCAMIADIFPYSPSGRALVGQTRAFERIWRTLEALRVRGARKLAMMINIRNIFQVLVSADSRYGPIYNFGAASIIEEALERAGYVEGCGAPVFLVGFSGGGQIAAGAVAFLNRRLKARVVVISVGGVFASPEGVNRASAFHHLKGDRDAVERLGAVMFPQRWRLFARSDWNRLVSKRRVMTHRLEGMTHTGPRGYYGPVKTSGDRTNFDRTLDLMADIVRSETARLTQAPDAAAPPAAPYPMDARSSFR